MHGLVAEYTSGQSHVHLLTRLAEQLTDGREVKLRLLYKY